MTAWAPPPLATMSGIKQVQEHECTFLSGRESPESRGRTALDRCVLALSKMRTVSGCALQTQPPQPENSLPVTGNSVLLAFFIITVLMKNV